MIKAIPGLIITSLFFIIGCNGNPDDKKDSSNSDHIINPGFETGGELQEPPGWDEWSPEGNTDASLAEPGGHTGNYQGVHRWNTAYEVYTSETLEGMSTGLYTLRAWVKSSGGQRVAVMNVKDYGGQNMEAVIPATGEWKEIIISNINVTGGEATFGFYSEAEANQWILFDDVKFELVFPGKWTRVFSDEFDGSTLNLSDWSPNWVVGSTAAQITVPVNVNEAAAYDPAQVTLSRGNLNLTLVQKPVNVNGESYNYRSGMIQSQGRKGKTALHEFVYGIIEARIYLPGSDGVLSNWPAFWADGQNWPYDGEMDILEGIHGTAHFAFHSWSAQYGDQDWQDPDKGANVTGDFTGWHIYGAQWQNGLIKYYYDGKLVGMVTKEITNKPMYLILNHATGGCCAGPIAMDTMKVDYVRVWQ